MSKLDEVFRQRLYEAEVPPPPAVWSLVEKELRRRRRRVAAWWFFGAFAMAALTTYWSLRPTGSRQQDTSAAVSLKEGTLPEKPFHSAGVPALPGVPIEIQEQVEPETTVPAVPVANNPSLRSAYSDAHPESNVSSGFSRDGEMSGQSALHTQKGILDVPSSVLPLTDTHADAGKHAPVSPQTPSPTGETEQVTGHIPVETASAFTAVRKATPLPLRSFKPLALPAQVAEINYFPLAKSKTRKKPKKHQHCYDFAAHPNVLLLDAYTGPSIVRKELRSVTPEDSWYRQQRLSTERQDWAFHAGLRATLLLNQHFLIRSGLHYDQVVEVFEYADPNYKEVNIRQRSVLVNGMWKTVSDTTVAYGEHYTKTYNRLGMLDIPLQGGLEVRNGRSGLSLQAGVSLNVLFVKGGSLLSMNDEPVTFRNAGLFCDRTGLSVSGSIQWFYHLQRRTRIFAEPYYRQILKPVTVPGQPVEQRYSIGGLRLGVTQILD